MKIKSAGSFIGKVWYPDSLGQKDPDNTFKWCCSYFQVGTASYLIQKVNKGWVMSYRVFHKILSMTAWINCVIFVWYYWAITILTNLCSAVLEVDPSLGTTNLLQEGRQTGSITLWAYKVWVHFISQSCHGATRKVLTRKVLTRKVLKDLKIENSI